jgi:hypothetical protein
MVSAGSTERHISDFMRTTKFLIPSSKLRSQAYWNPICTKSSLSVAMAMVGDGNGGDAF